jgi:Zn-dependent peptidase ImmA (M78 family)
VSTCGEKMPINPNVLRWARERAGLSTEEAAKKLHRRFAMWEVGEDQPTYPQLEQLAEFLHIPVAVFFFPEPPTIPEIRKSFRTLPEAEFDRIPPRVRRLIDKAKAMQLNLAELCDGKNPATRLITRDLTFAVGTDVELFAKRVREYLGVTVEGQFSWPNNEAALTKWRDLLQSAGIFVFKEAFREDYYLGFSIADETFPIVFVNNSSAKARQSFTILHELAHLLAHTSGIDTLDEAYVRHLQGKRRSLEVGCNALASQVLMPEETFIQLVRSRDHSEQTAEFIADRFHVSREVVYRRFLDRRWITQAEYLAAKERWDAQARLQQPGGGGDYYNTKMAYLGREYISLALQAYHQERIDEVMLADYLDTSAKNAVVLAERFARSAA